MDRFNSNQFIMLQLVVRMEPMLISKFNNHNIEDQIICMEKEYSIVIPVQYKVFLHKYNGGYTPKTKFRVGKISSDVRGFLA